MLYLTGYRVNESWSLFSMQGVRRAKTSGTAKWAGIANPSIYRSLTPLWTVGLKTNFIVGTAALRQQLLMPQVQVQFGGGWIVQAGVGIENGGSAPLRPAFAMRVTRVLR